jgi:hypothetical protein
MPEEFCLSGNLRCRPLRRAHAELRRFSYSNDRLIVTPLPGDGLAKVANCNSSEVVLQESNLGFVPFSAPSRMRGATLDGSLQSAGCRGTATWSSIKAMYDEGNR